MTARPAAAGPNPLALLPAKARKAAYVGYGIAALGVSATQVGYSSIELGQPPWLTVTVAVVAFLAVPFSSLAATHVGQSPEPAQANDLPLRTNDGTWASDALKED